MYCEMLMAENTKVAPPFSVAHIRCAVSFADAECAATKLREDLDHAMMELNAFKVRFSHSKQHTRVAHALRRPASACHAPCPTQSLTERGRVSLCSAANATLAAGRA